MRHTLGWWAKQDGGFAVEIFESEAALADRRQQYDDAGGYTWVGWTPCDCGCEGVVNVRP